MVHKEAAAKDPQSGLRRRDDAWCVALRRWSAYRRVHGDVLAVPGGHSLLVSSENVRVHGKVKAEHVIISGEVLGPIHCDDLLELQPKARIVGDVRYGTLEMHHGASINVELRSLMLVDRPTLTLAASIDL